MRTNSFIALRGFAFQQTVLDVMPAFADIDEPEEDDGRHAPDDDLEYESSHSQAR